MYYNKKKQEYWSDEWCDWMEDVYHDWLDDLKPYHRARKDITALFLFFGMTECLPQQIREQEANKEQLRELIKISSIAEQSCELREVGKNKYQAKCPFHTDRRASMSIDDEKGLFHCFGCNTSGDIFSWLMIKYELDFKEALNVARKLI